MCLLTVLGTLLFTFVLLLVQIREERRQRARNLRNAMARRLRFKRDDSEVVSPKLPGANWFHLFLSHVWGTGQDQMRIIKTRLIEMLPDLRVFLE